MTFNANFSLFTAKERKSDKSPHQTGTVEILASDIAAVINHLQTAQQENNYRDEAVVKLRIAAWETESKGGLQYLNGKISPPMPKTEDQPF